jgi:hypothetical protein
MTNVTITVDGAQATGETAVLAAFLHDPGGPFQPRPLRIDHPNAVRDLPDGLYYVSLAATALKAETAIPVTFEADGGNKKTRAIETNPDGTIGGMLPFGLKDGKVR